MTSKNSIYKMTLEHLRHSSWMLALSFIGNLIAGPIILLFEYSNRDFTYIMSSRTWEEFLLYKAQEMAENLLGFCGSLFLAVAMIGALFTALGIFYYLFQSNKIDLYHSLPLTRNELFYSGYLAGLLIWLIPFLISCIITLPIAIFCAGGVQHINMLLVAFLKMLLIPLIGFLITYHLCLVGVMLSGNMSNAIIAILVWGLTPLVFYGLITMHFEHYFDTFYQFNVNEFVLYGIAPLSTPIAIQSYLLADTEFASMAILIVLGLIIAVLNFFVARKIYQKRKSELAGRGMESKTATFLIRFTSSLAAGFFGVVFLYFLGTNRGKTIWSIGFCLFFSIFTTAVLSAVQKKTVKGLFAHKGQMLLTAALSISFILVCRFDVFGYDTYVPKKENIKNMEIRIDAMTNYYYNMNDYFYEVSDTDVIYDVLQAGTQESPYVYATHIVVKVTPKNGFSYYRTYPIPVDKKESLRPIIEDKQYFDFLYKNYTDNWQYLDSMYLYDIGRNRSEISDAELTKSLWQAYYTDLLEHRTMEEMTYYFSVGQIEFIHNYNIDGSYYLRELPIPMNFKHTIKFLEENCPNLTFTKEKLQPKALKLYVELREEMTVEEFYRELLTPPAELPMRQGSPDFKPVVTSESVSISTYNCELTGEALDTIYPYLQICRDTSDMLREDSFVYVGDLELMGGNNVNCYIEKGSLTDEDIQTLSAIVEQNKIADKY